MMPAALLVSAIAGAALILQPATARAQQHTCVLTMSMTSEVDVNNLDFQLGYANADGEVEGSGDEAQCSRAFRGSAIVAFNDVDATDTLKVAIVSASLLHGPLTLGGCLYFYDTNIPEPSDFTILVTNAGVGGQDNNVRPRPKVEITKIECPGTLPQPTSTTTTTLPGQCGIVVSGGDTPTATDSLAALRAAVGSQDCDPCVCDVDGNGLVTATDALTILRAAVGLPASLDCPGCAGLFG